MPITVATSDLAAGSMANPTNSTSGPAMVARPCAAPDLLALHRFDPARYPFLLESAAQGGGQGRWDMLFAFPGATLTRHADGRLTGPGAEQGGFLAALDAWFAQEARSTAPRGELPFAGGWFLFLAYELAAEIEPRLRLEAAPHLPVATAVRVPVAVLRDRQRGEDWLVAEAAHAARLDDVAADIARLGAVMPAPAGAALDGGLIEDQPQRYLDAVTRAQRYVYDGDVFQANLSRAWRGKLAPGEDAATIYARLRAVNPAPFAALARFDAAAVASSSPERLVEVRGTRIQTRPIAGTRPRGADAAADAALRAELLLHPKERAEHVMLVDLERNDLSRVARAGTVRVPELMTLETYATVHHIVSNVEGELRAGVTPGQVIAAVFPGGTITGCPKVRCMEIIAELEAAPRGAYTGSLGYLGLDGSVDLSILIRTLTVAGDGTLAFRAGAGIVHDSVPARELEETRAKARGLTRALGVEA